MATIPQLRLARNTVSYYAHYGDVEGIAYQMAGGYLFQADGANYPNGAMTVATTDPELVLHGRKDLADAQRAADGDYLAQICGR